MERVVTMIPLIERIVILCEEEIIAKTQLYLNNSECSSEIALRWQQFCEDEIVAFKNTGFGTDIP